MKEKPLDENSFIGYAFLINQAIGRKMTEQEYKQSLQGYINGVDYKQMIKQLEDNWND